jgi:hypothetical protein
MFEFLKNKVGEKNFLSISSFPLLGCKENYYCNKESYENVDFEVEDFELEFSFEKHPYNSKKLIENNIFSKSLFSNDDTINSHPRFGCLTKNILNRRGKKVEILIPIYKDINTNYEKTDDEPFPGKIYMDSMVFGMGCTCFQITLGCCSLESCLYMYDQLVPLAPLLVLKFIILSINIKLQIK